MFKSVLLSKEHDTCVLILDFYIRHICLFVFSQLRHIWNIDYRTSMTHQQISVTEVLVRISDPRFGGDASMQHPSPSPMFLLFNAASLT